MNSKAIDQINEARKRNSLILFTGAGISRYLNLPSWRDLVLIFYKEVEKEDNLKSHLIPAIANDQIPLLYALELIKAYKPIIYSELKKAIDVHLNNPVRHKKLWNLSSKIITTNYDKAFEIAHPSISPIIHNYNYELAKIKDQSAFYFKIHGSIENVESCILFEEDFINLYKEDSLAKTVFKNLITNNTFLFIGFSMSDPYITGIFDYLNKHYKSYLDKHYFVSVEDIDFSYLNIQTIRLKDWDLAFDDFINLISEESYIDVKDTDDSEFKNEIENCRTNFLIPKPTKSFTGRNEEIRAFEQIFSNYNIITVEGLGGIGKTEFVSKFIESLPQDSIVWFDCKENSQFETLIDTCGYQGLLKSETSNQLSTFLGFKDLIERDNKVIVIDNYQDLRDDSFIEFFKFLRNSLINSRIIILLREKIHIDGVDLYHFPISGLKGDSLEYAKKVIALTHHELKYISDNKLRDICNELEGHPFAIQVAIQLLIYEQNGDSIIAIIKQYQTEKDKLSSRLLGEVFSHPKSTKQEIGLLINFSVFRSKVSIKGIEQVYGEGYREPLKSLIDKLMISRVGNFYSSHPLVREFSYDRLIDKCELHKKAIEYYKGLIKFNSDLNTYEELFYHFQASCDFDDMFAFVENEGEHLMNYGYYVLLRNKILFLLDKRYESPRVCNYMADLEIILGNNAERSMFYSERALAISSDDKEAILEAHISIAETKKSKNELEDPLGHFSSLYEQCKAIGFLRGEIICLSYIGSLLVDRGLKSDGEMKMIRAQKSSYDSNYHSGISHCSQMLGTYFLKVGKSDKAYTCYETMLNHFRSLGNHRLISIAEDGIAVVLTDTTTKYDEALKIFKDNLDIYREMGDKSREATSLYNIGVCLYYKKSKDYSSYIENAIDIWKSIEDYKNLHHAFHALGKIELNSDNLKEALRNYLEAVIYAEKIRLDLTSLYNSISSLRSRMGTSQFDDNYLRFYSNLLIKEREVLDYHNLSFKPIKKEDVPGRNEPCYCGNGKKFKHCHGKS